MVLFLIFSFSPFSFFLFLLLYNRFQFNHSDISNFLELSQLIHRFQGFSSELNLPTSLTALSEFLPFLDWVLELVENFSLVLLQVYVDLWQNSWCHLQRNLWLFNWFVNGLLRLSSLLFLTCRLSCLLWLGLFFFLLEYLQAPSKVLGQILHILIWVISGFWNISGVLDVPVIVWLFMEDIRDTEKAQVSVLLILSFRRFDKFSPVYFLSNVFLMHWHPILIKLKSIWCVLHLLALLFFIVLSYTVESCQQYHAFNILW